MDAIIYLRAEHSEFRKTLAVISKTANEKAKQTMFNKFCKNLSNHEKMEEKIWYPVLRKNLDLRDIIKHLISEEKSAARTIKTIQQIKPGIIWKLKFYKFKHDVNHHAKGEEQELFPKVRKFLNKQELNDLGVKMRKFKASLK